MPLSKAVAKRAALIVLKLPHFKSSADGASAALDFYIPDARTTTKATTARFVVQASSLQLELLHFHPEASDDLGVRLSRVLAFDQSRMCVLRALRPIKTRPAAGISA
jgi:hypothetical protein